MSYLHPHHAPHRGCTTDRNIAGTLEFQRNAVLADVKKYAYVEGDIMKAEREHDRHQVFDIAEECGGIERVNRVMKLTYHEAVEMLYPYTVEELTEDVELDDAMVAPEAYVIHLSLPREFSATTISYLSVLLHEYFVYRIMEDWMSITNPTAQQRWLEKCESTKSKVTGALCVRGKFVHRRMTPF